jgi:hypothetical protein
MNSSQVIDLLNHLEARYPVAQWRIGGLHIWPILRARLYHAIVHFYLLSADQHPASARSLRQRFLSTPLNLWRMARAMIRDGRHTRLGFRRADVLFLSDGTSFSDIEGIWYDRIMDPIVARLAARDMKSFIMSPGWLSLAPRNQPSLFIQPRLEMLKILATIHLRFSGHPAVELNGLDSMLGELRAEEFGTVVPGQGWLFAHTARIVALAGYFAKALRKVRPRIGLVNTYYSAEGYAFCVACHRAGVPVADVQHGSQGRDHMAYGRWQALPQGGYELMPDRFWCWSPAEAEAIAEWSGGTRHSPYVAGNPWRDIWRADSEAFVRPLRDQALALRRRSGMPHHVLVVLSWGLAEEEALKVFRALSTLPAGQHFFWIRLHPVEHGKESEVARQARDCGLAAFDVDAASALPLYAVFAAVDLVVALGSTVVMEAEAWGLRSVVTTAYGGDICKPSIQSGAAVLAIQEDDIARAVRAGLAAAPMQAAAETTPAGGLDAALDNLLAVRCAR